ncbi:MAG: acetyl-CoA C-acyltransferase [bacterium]|nr:acetyl-CoA C-acyltransferase [bacterium]
MATTRPVAILGGVRTPFVKAGTAYKDYTFQQLGAKVIKSLVQRLHVDAGSIDEVIFGTVLLDPRTPNWAREIVFMAGLPKHVEAHSVSNNCISGLTAMAFAADRIALGRTDAAIFGGSESMSNPTLVYGDNVTKVFLALTRARSVSEKLKLISKLKLRYFIPRPPAVTEPSTGLTMGQHMEITAKSMGITREAQDSIAYESHRRAALAWSNGLFASEVEPHAGVETDLLVRSDTTIEKLSKLKTVFDRSDKATITAGNASALTDGASAVLLASDDWAREKGLEVLGWIADFEFAAIDPEKGLLMAPGIAVPELLRRNGLKFADFDRIEIHEAFAAQVEANIQDWNSRGEFGEVPRDKVNVNGGSIALGHPFAATGGRLVTALASELKRNNLKRGLISICAAGAMAGAVIIERH